MSKSPHAERLGFHLQVAFLVAALVLLVAARERPEIQTLSVIFVSIVLEAFPFMLLGALVGGLIEVFVARDRIAALLPTRRWVGVGLAALLGLLFPVCECAVVPVVRRLLRKGVPFAAAVAYLLGGPIVNPLVAGSTAVAYNYDLRVVGLRIVFGYIVAVAVGLAVGKMFEGKNPLEGADECHEDCCHTGAAPSKLSARIHEALSHAGRDFFDIGRFLVIGAFVAALLQTIVSREIFLSVREEPGVCIGLMMLLAITLNLCSEADAFVAASFRTLTPLSGQLAFMVLGPMVDVKLLLMYLGVFKRRAIVAISLLATAAVFGLAMAFELWGPAIGQ